MSGLMRILFMMGVLTLPTAVVGLRLKRHTDLSSIMESRMQTLTRELESQNDLVRRNAAETLSGESSPAAVPALIESLQGDEDAWVRSAAASTLGSICPILQYGIEGDPDRYGILHGDESYQPVPPLIAVVQVDKHSIVRSSAARALGLCQDADAIPALTAAAEGDEDYEVRKAAVKALGDIGWGFDLGCQRSYKKSLAALLAAFHRDNELDIRSVAAEALGNFYTKFDTDSTCNEEVVSVLISALDEDSGVDDTVLIKALGRIGKRGFDDTVAVQTLRRGLLSEDWPSQKRVAAIEALTLPLDTYNDQLEEAVPDLQFVMKNARDVNIRIAAARALGGTFRHSGNAVVGLIAALHADVDWRLRQSALLSLGEIGSEEALPALIVAMQANKNDSIIQRRMQTCNAIAALGQVAGNGNDLRALPALLAALHGDEAASVRSAAAKAMRLLLHSDVAYALVAAMQKDQDMEVRYTAVKTLAQVEVFDDIVEAHIVEALIDVLQTDEEEVVRAHAAEALSKMGWVNPTGVKSALFAAMQGNMGPNVSQAAVTSLGYMGVSHYLFGVDALDAVASLITFMQEGDFHMRRAAAQALSMFGHSAVGAVAPLISAMENDKAPAVRQQSTAALGHIDLQPHQCEMAVTALKARMMHDLDFEVRVEAKRALMKGFFSWDHRQLCDDETDSVKDVQI